MAKNKKDITVYFHLINKSVGVDNFKISSTEIRQILDSIQKLPVDIHSNLTRFFDDAGTERCIILDSDSSNSIPKIKNKSKSCVHGIYFKRRKKNYPYENDGTSNLFQIQLSASENELAEITYFIIDKKNKILSFVSNRYAGSIQDFENYINKKFRDACKAFLLPNLDKNNQAINITFPFILNEDSDSDFNGMTHLSSMDIKIGGSLSALEPYVSKSKFSGAEAMQSLVNFCEESNAKTVTLSMGVGRTQENINKKKVKELYKILKTFLKNDTKGNSFKVKGTIDTETRFLDLVRDDFFHKTTFTYSQRYLPLDEVFEKLYDIHKKYIEIFLKKGILN